MSKKCIQCGEEIPKDAVFCPHCTASQEEKREIKTPKIWRKKAISFVVAVFLVLIGVFVVAKYSEPEVYEGGAEIVYTDDDGVYHVLVTFSATDGVMKDSQKSASIELPESQESAFPSQLYVYKEGTEELVIDEFMSKVKDYTLEVTPLDGAEEMRYTGPVSNESFPYAALVSDIIYTSECGTNEILWTLNMENGDQILLKQSIHVTVKEGITYYPEDVPMNTAEELQALIDQIEEEDDSDKMVYLYLPPVTYDGEIQFGDRPYTLYGGTDGENVTTFSKTVSMYTDYAQFSEIYEVRFVGEGGTGLSATNAVILFGCTFEGWEIGAVAQSGGWVCAKGCLFKNNTVALKFDSFYSVSSDGYYDSNTFEGNGTGIWIKDLPGKIVLDFTDTKFTGNGTDIQNDAEHSINTSGAIFE